MTDKLQLTEEELKHAQDMGAATYLSAYVHRMAAHLGVEGTTEELKAMAVALSDCMSFGTQAAWCALMKDQEGTDRSMGQLDEALENLMKS